MNIYLVTWQHAKKSGIVGAYPTEEAAKKVLDLLVNHGDLSKKFALVLVEEKVEVDIAPLVDINLRKCIVCGGSGLSHRAMSEQS